MTKVKIPKRIAGVKLPKKLRKQARKTLKRTESAAVRELALAGLTLAAQAMLARPRRRSPGLEGLDLPAMVQAAVAEGARRFLEGYEDGVRTGAGSPAPAG